MDAIVERGKIEDDNFKFVRGFEVDFGDAGKDVQDYIVVELFGEINDKNDKD